MPQIPRLNKSSKVGTNLPNAEARAAQHKKDLNAVAAKYRKAQAAFRRQRDRVLTKPVIRKLAPTVEAIRSDFAKAALKAGGDLGRVAAAKKRARKAMADALKKNVPKLGELRRQESAFAKLHAKIVAQEFQTGLVANLPAFIPDLEPLNPPPPQQLFTFPYSFFDVRLSGLDDGLFVFNESFAQAESGVIVENVHFRHDESDWSLYNPSRLAQIVTSVGVEFTVPETGFLSGFAVVHNLFNKVTASVSDNFGFSHSYLSFDANLFVEIIRSGESTFFTRNMLHGELNSGGGDASMSSSDIPDQVPIVLPFEPHDAFLKGEVIRVMVGSFLTIESDTDDMDAHVNALIVWQVNGIALGMKA